MNQWYALCHVSHRNEWHMNASPLSYACVWSWVTHGWVTCGRVTYGWVQYEWVTYECLTLIQMNESNMNEWYTNAFVCDSFICDSFIFDSFIFDSFIRMSCTPTHWYITRSYWLRSVGSIKLQVSFAEYRLFYRGILQKRLIILSILLTKATPYGYLSEIAEPHMRMSVINTQLVYETKCDNRRKCD